MFNNKDEFNETKIVNEDGNGCPEFGDTQDAEYTFYADNKNKIRDEVNDNPSSNDENKSPEKEEKRRKEEQQKDSSEKTSKGSSGSSGSSSAGSISASAAAVAAAVCVVVGIVSISAGPVTPEISNVNLTPHETSINCEFDIYNNDSAIKYKIELYNDEIEAHYEKESQIGHNELEFTDLASSTEYTFEILRGNPDEQQEYSYQSIYSETVTTLAEPVPTGSVVLSFDANYRDGTMGSLELDAGSEYSLPICIFVPFDDEYFGGWKVNGEGALRQPGETIVVKRDTTLVAAWTKFPTEEQTVTADNYFFSYFSEQPTAEISSVTLMNIEFLYSNVYYSSDDETLNMNTNTAFVSTTRPFAGPIKSITVNSKSVNYDLTMVYSASPIYEKVTEGGETKTIEFSQDYTFTCTNPDARYFCLSTDNDSNSPSFEYMKFVYETPVIDNEFTIYFDANGGSGSCPPQTLTDLNKEQLPTVERVGFTAPDGYEFAGWKIQGVEDLLAPGTVVGLTSDLTLIAQWKPKPVYTVTFNSDGGTPIDPQTVISGECAVRPDDPTKNAYVFLDWYTDEQEAEPYDFTNPVTDNLTLIARWKPDVDFSMYINYVDTLSTSASNELSFKYTKNDQYSHYVDYNLELDGASEDIITLGIGALENTETFTTKTSSLSSAAISALGTGIVNYTMKGITSSGDAYEVATGSLSMSRTQKDHVAFVYFGDKALQEDNTGETFRAMVSGSTSSPGYYLPIRFDYADFNNVHRSGNEWRLRYTLDGESYTNSTFYYSGGTTFINIGTSLFASTDTVTFKEISFLDGNSTPQQVGGVYKNVTVQASDEKYVGGFKMSYLLDKSRTPTFTLSAVGTRGTDPNNPDDNFRFINLGAVDDGSFEARLAFRLLSKNGHVEKEYTIDVTQNLISNASKSIMYTNVEFNFIDANTGLDKREEFIEQSKRFVVDVELTIISSDETPLVCTSYESYSFR